MSVTFINPFLAGTAGPPPAVFPTANQVISLDVHDTGNRSVSGGQIVSLTDPISGNVLVNAFPTKPNLLTANINGYDAADFSTGGSGTCAIWDTTPTAIPAVNTSQTMVAVARLVGATGGGFFIETGRTGGGGMFLGYFDTSLQHRLACGVGGTSGNSTSENWTGSAYDIVVLSYDHPITTAKIWRNNTVFGSPNFTMGSVSETGSSTSFAIGEGDWYFTFFSLWNVGCDATMLYNIVGSLGTKYGITVA